MISVAQRRTPPGGGGRCIHIWRARAAKKKEFEQCQNKYFFSLRHNN
jgi:hypothetical protein